MTRALVALVALALALPAAAAAQVPPTNAPPGNSAIEEYLETVPGATGNARPHPPAQGANTLSAAERARLERLGPDGKALADAVDATSSGKKRSKQEIAPDGDGRSPVGQVLDAFAGSDGGSGMGVVLPAILISALLAAILLVLLRRRAAS